MKHSLMSLTFVTGGSLKRSSTPRSEEPKDGPGRTDPFRFSPLNWYEKLNTMQFLSLWLTMWCRMYHDSLSLVHALDSYLSTKLA